MTATPTQARVDEQLFARWQARPEFRPTLADDLRTYLERELSPIVADRQPDEALVLSKRTISNVHSCEGLLEADRKAGFSWSPVTARGTVAHKAVELSIALRDNPAPLDLVDFAIERLIDGADRGISSWLLDAPAAHLAELRGQAGDWVTKFQDTFPPLNKTWRPRLESSLTVELCGRRVELRGKVDLALGRAEGTQARVLIIDFKSGKVHPVHAQDLRFYALLETIRVGVPPFRLATFSLDSGTWVAEDVDEDILLAAARRTVDAAIKIAELEGGRPAELRAGAFCRWCPARTGCPTADAAEARARDDQPMEAAF